MTLKWTETEAVTMMYENFRHTHGSGSGAGEDKFCVLPDDSILFIAVFTSVAVYFARV